MINDKEKEENKTTFNRVSKRWKESIDKVQEYEIVNDHKEVLESPFGLTSFNIEYQEYEKAERLKEKLLKDYKDKRLEDVIKGKEFISEHGRCYQIETRDKISLRMLDPKEASEKILSNLKLIYGIGEIRERILKEEGYKTIEDLTKHPYFGLEASRFLEILNKRETSQVIDWITRWVSKSDPLVLYSSAMHKKENFIIFDIETLGLFSRPVILIGLARILDDDILIYQYLIRNIEEEPAVLKAFLSHIDEQSIFITFNGRAFDLPYIEERLAYYRMRGELEKPHFDVLYFSRRAWGRELPNCKLKTLERYLLGIEREDDIPSALVPHFYETYLKTNNIGPLMPIIEHNKQDLITLAYLFFKLHEEWG